MASSTGYGSTVHSNEPNGEESESVSLLTVKARDKGDGNQKQTNITCAALLLLATVIGGVALFTSPRVKTLVKSSSASVSRIEDIEQDNINVVPKLGRKRYASAEPLSKLDPVKDLDLLSFQRPNSSSPARPLTDNGKRASYPTNSWYQSLLMPEGEPTEIYRTYTVPYLVDAAGPIPGIQVHPNQVAASSTVVQLNVVTGEGLTLGAATADSSTKKPTQMYNVTRTTPIGLTLAWNVYPMTSTITYGMPYMTMQYSSIGGVFHKGEEMFPTIGSSIALHGPPILDGAKKLKCDTKHPVRMEREMEMLYDASDFTWVAFVSEPVMVQCITHSTGAVMLQIVEFAQGRDIARDLVVRVALAKQCSKGRNPIYCHQQKLHPTALLLGQGHYDSLLRDFADLFPGPETSFNYEFGKDGNTSKLIFDWDAKSMSDIALYPLPPTNTSGKNVIGFALPHQFDSILQVPPTDHDLYCVASLVGPACLYEGSVWELVETIPDIGFRAPRSPSPWSIPFLAKSLQDDIQFSLPEFFERGAGDTYFSGKMLAKLARIVLIAEEFTEICGHHGSFPAGYEEVCGNAALPSTHAFEKAVNRLKSSVEVWVNGTAEIPFVYDAAWGGVVSCGCDFDGRKGVCKNKFPHCPGFEDPGLNFGNAFYNDIHFHYGYFIYAAAVGAHFDPSWGRDMFEPILLLIRCIANPSEDDPHFSLYKYKDWFRGHSWASGIATIYLNGKNQESSSEAIAAYEGVTLFGDAMVRYRLALDDESHNFVPQITAFAQEGLVEQEKVATQIKQLGAVLTATELKSARRYWHLESEDGIKVFPKEYTRGAVGMLWQCMAQLQTWFGSAPYLAYGIQLLPLTPVAEHRDSIPWSEEIFHTYAKTCGADLSCVTNGWSVLEYALLATIGHQEEAAGLALDLPLGVFDRPLVANPFPVDLNDTSYKPLPDSYQPVGVRAKDCGKPETCTDFVLDTIAGLYSCRQRIEWLMGERGQSERDACYQVAGVENPSECGGCNPEGKDFHHHDAPTCAPCTLEECTSELNRCPVFGTTFVCTEGLSIGGCTSWPWKTPSTQCESCCELTHCPKPSPAETMAQDKLNCPPCSQEACRGPGKQCPAHFGEGYLCIEGPGKDGCSIVPWSLTNGECSACCSLLPGCGK